MHAPHSESISHGTRLLGGLRDIAQHYDVILCDVWGVIHNGAAYFPKAVDALSRFRDKGGTVVLITNAPRPRGHVVDFLDSLGVPHTAYDGLVSSGDITVSMIIARGDQPLLHIGPLQDRSLFAAAEDLSGRAVRFARLEEASFVVCTGFFDVERETPDDYATQLDLMRRRDLDFICANPDIVVEVGDRLVYCAGALAEAYAARGGRVIQAGKPHPPIYARALAEAAALSGKETDLSRVLAVGDAMHTDIRGAQAQSLDSLFVTLGIHRADLHGKPQTTEFDAAVFRQFFENLGFAPSMASPELVW
ncbi:TIGR01459 family HAD-type hydrolase [Methylovirgula sp. HY1]|uniref:TIGR01459 family HAD-type hydrolase n=1 Tax=Methylovirgula sp. HY1 TaxID=2822761 RepID=UPI001C5AE593|nr:TIGR01459 family HAD-type hydrolase [Methylovirgula sp. HY1]QXX73227.1 Acid sugar phosphatase [Methylovirgula sp. HY1]